MPVAVINNLKLSGLQDILNIGGVNDICVIKPELLFYSKDHQWHKVIEPRLTKEMCESFTNNVSVYNKGVKLRDCYIKSGVLPNGERCEMNISPASEYTVFTIRKKNNSRFSLEDFENTGRLLPTQKKEILSDDLLNKLFSEKRYKDFLTESVKAKKNILLVGETGSGKTTLLQSLVDCYPEHYRIITIEDVHEITLPKHENHVHLFFKDSVDTLTPTAALKSCMRHAPDIILLGECRDGELSKVFLNALNTGHEGSITTIHANSCKTAIYRMADLIKESEVGQTMDYDLIVRQVKSSLDVIIFMKDTFIEEYFVDFNK